MTHAVVPLAIALASGRARIPVGLAASGMLLSMAPDLDVVTFRLGIDYGSSWGHRGATHSLLIAALAAAVVFPFVRAPHRSFAFLFLFVSAASHGLLDALTSGTYGPALFWPFLEERVFASIRPIRVSPIGAAFFTARGLETVWSELTWVWAPASALAGLGWISRRAFGASGQGIAPARQSPD